jgi:thiol-disulfide isomerase/thioredoxin
MEQVLRNLDVEVYIDDIGIFSNSWEDHCKALDAVLECLQENRFKVNPLKCE